MIIVWVLNEFVWGLYGYCMGPPIQSHTRAGKGPARALYGCMGSITQNDSKRGRLNRVIKGGGTPYTTHTPIQL